jgi:hypothetical protein
VVEKTISGIRKRKTGSQPETEKGVRQGVSLKTITSDRKIKSERDEFSDRYETDYSKSSDSEDEMPLAKRRHGGTKTVQMPFEALSAAQMHQGVSSVPHDVYDNPCVGHSFLEGRCGQQEIAQGQSQLPGKHLNIYQNTNSTNHQYEPTTKLLLEVVADQLKTHDTPCES